MMAGCHHRQPERPLMSFKAFGEGGKGGDMWLLGLYLDIYDWPNLTAHFFKKKVI